MKHDIVLIVAFTGLRMGCKLLGRTNRRIVKA